MRARKRNPLPLRNPPGEAGGAQDGEAVLGTRPVRAVANAVIASVVQGPAVYVSAGLVFHQGPPGGGVVAAIVRA